MHAAADGECGGGAIFERLGIIGDIGAINGVEFHLREAGAVLESACAYLGHGGRDGKRSREVATFFEHFGWDSLHTAADGERGGTATVERRTSNISTIDGVVVYLREVLAVLESVKI